jgi:hypothetical protein
MFLAFEFQEQIKTAKRTYEKIPDESGKSIDSLVRFTNFDSLPFHKLKVLQIKI